MKSLLHSRIGRAPSSETLTPSSHKQRQPRFPKENVDPNTLPQESSPFQSPPVSGKSPAARTRSPLPPRPPPSSNRLKRKLGSETLSEKGDATFSNCDSGVQVMVRLRPLNEEEEGVQIVQKISSNSISIFDHTFTFDSVADASSSQHDIFQFVGVPLVENCLSGFNSSIFAYGQTGSGKTYTMWGPPNSLMEEGLLNPERGLTPRVFELLFSRINQIYNEQITDLLDPVQRNLQIREDVRTGVYVEGLKEEYICTMKDLLQLLIMGLANRRTGATSINADSSRSHCVFTCILESQYKSMDDGLISSRTSRINLVDLAGSERQKATGAAGERLKEAGSINRSLSQLGNLINILAEVTQSGRNRHIPYRDSKLTFLLQDSLGGNAKLAVICAISPSKSCKSENFSTLRFAQRAKAIKNKAIVNETIEDDVNVLREQIRQLKDELLRMKSNDKPAESNGACSIGWNVRRSLSLLRLSLCHPRTLPVEDDSDEEMEIVKEGVESLCAEAHSPLLDENKSSVNEEPIISEGFKEHKPFYSDDRTVSTDICRKKAPEICSEIHLSSINGNTSNVNEELTYSESSKEQQPCYSDKENALADICFKKVPDFGFECDHDREFRHSGEKICKIQQRAAASCRTESQCGEIVEIASGLVSPIAGMNENVNKDVDVSKMIPAKRKLSADGPTKITERISTDSTDPTEITERISTDSTDPSGSMFPDQSHSCSSPPSHVSHSSLRIVNCKTSSIQSPTLGVSPKLDNHSRKSLRTSTSVTASQRTVIGNAESDSGGLNISSSDFLNKSNTHLSPSQSRKVSLGTTENLATSLCQGLRIITDNHHSSSLRNASFRFSLRPDMKLLIPMNKADVGTQTLPQESILTDDSSVFICSYCKCKAQPLENNDNIGESDLQLVPIGGSDSLCKPQSSKGCKKPLPKAVEKVLAGAIRREMALEDQCAKKAAEIMHLNRLIQQYKHERECREIIEQAHGNKICRLESLMDGVMPTEEFMEKEFLSLKNEHMILKEKYENHPEVLRLNIELKMLQNDLDGYRNFFDRGERDVLVEEIEDLRCHLSYYIDSSSMSTWNKCPLLQMTHSTEPISDPLGKVSEKTDESSDEKFGQERRDWTERERKWILLYGELRTKLDVSQSLAEKLKIELESEKKCTQELKEALQTALQVHTRTLEHYADLEEKHMTLLGRHRKMREGISNLKKLPRIGIKGDSNFIQSLATQVEALRNERKRERQYWRDEKKALQIQLMDTAEALQAAGELLIRLKQAEEVVATAEERASAAEKKAEKAYQETEVMKKKYDEEIATLNKLLAESRSPKKGQVDEFSAGTEPHSWFYDYDQCNI